MSRSRVDATRHAIIRIGRKTNVTCPSLSHSSQLFYYLLGNDLLYWWYKNTRTHSFNLSSHTFPHAFLVRYFLSSCILLKFGCNYWGGRLRLRFYVTCAPHWITDRNSCDVRFTRLFSSYYSIAVCGSDIFIGRQRTVDQSSSGSVIFYWTISLQWSSSSLVFAMVDIQARHDHLQWFKFFLSNEIDGFVVFIHS